MMNSSLSSISRRFMQLAIRSNARQGKNVNRNVQGLALSTAAKSMSLTTTSTSTNSSWSSTIRTFSSNDDSNKNDNNDNNDNDNNNDSQQQWNEWQNNFFQDENASPIIKKRGGKIARKKEELKKLSSQDTNRNRLLDGAGTGQFPPLRYSDEETERLLAQAYASIPERTGKRGTRALKRQKVRYHGIRKARSIKKAERIAHHFDRMEKRSKKVQDILRMKEIAVESREEDKAYQMEVLKKWADMNGLISSAAAASASTSASVAVEPEVIVNKEV